MHPCTVPVDDWRLPLPLPLPPPPPPPRLLRAPRALCTLWCGVCVCHTGAGAFRIAAVTWQAQHQYPASALAFVCLYCTLHLHRRWHQSIHARVQALKASCAETQQVNAKLRGDVQERSPAVELGACFPSWQLHGAQANLNRRRRWNPTSSAEPGPGKQVSGACSSHSSAAGPRLLASRIIPIGHMPWLLLLGHTVGHTWAGIEFAPLQPRLRP
jgi:hypothetical protein